MRRKRYPRRLRERYERNHELFRIHDCIEAGRKVRYKAIEISTREIEAALEYYRNLPAAPAPTVLMITTPEPFNEHFRRFSLGLDLASKEDICVVRFGDGTTEFNPVRYRKEEIAKWKEHLNLKTD